MRARLALRRGRTPAHAERPAAWFPSYDDHCWPDSLAAAVDARSKGPRDPASPAGTTGNLSGNSRVESSRGRSDSSLWSAISTSDRCRWAGRPAASSGRRCDWGRRCEDGGRSSFEPGSIAGQPGDGQNPGMSLSKHHKDQWGAYYGGTSLPIRFDQSGRQRNAGSESAVAPICETMRGMSDVKYDLVVIGSGPPAMRRARPGPLHFGKRLRWLKRLLPAGGAAAKHFQDASFKTLRETALYRAGFRRRGLHGVTLGTVRSWSRLAIFFFINRTLPDTRARSHSGQPGTPSYRSVPRVRLIP